MYESERLEMVDRLVSYGYLRTKKVIEAMKGVPRHLFVPKKEEKHAYEDRPLPVGESQTISAPHMVAIMCEALHLEEEHRVLEVGAGTGYHACVVAQMVEEVFTVERIEVLARRAEENLKKADCGETKVIVGDGSIGYKEAAPYDRIFVTAGAPDMPRPLLDQLKIGGRLLIPVGRKYYQDLILVEKTVEGESQRNLGACAFVPLIGEYGRMDDSDE